MSTQLRHSRVNTFLQGVLLGVSLVTAKHFREIKQRRRRRVPLARAKWKLNLYFTSEIRECLDLLGYANGSKNGVQFQMEIRKICRRPLGHFTLLFCRRRQGNVQRYITHVHIVLLIKPFVLWCSRCRRSRGLLKLPNNVKWPHFALSGGRKPRRLINLQICISNLLLRSGFSFAIVF